MFCFPKTRMIPLRRIVSHFALVSMILTYATFVYAQRDFSALVKKVALSVAVINVFNREGELIGLGTGFFIKEEGLLVTNYHVIEGAMRAEVNLSNGEILPIEGIISEDREGDLVLLTLKVKSRSFPALKLAGADIKAGQPVVVIGSPLGLDLSVSDGIISAIRDVPELGKILQITAPISKGSSGSPVLNMKGEVIGVATLYIKEGQSLNFAISVDRVKGLLSRRQAKARKFIGLVESEKQPSLTREDVRGEKENGLEEIELVFVKGGCFQMGDTFGDGDSDEKPVHEVCVDDFWMGKYEVTQGQWKKVMGNNPSYFKNGDNYPVESITVNNVYEFIRKLNQKTGKRYRLPYEAEWEYAARSGGKREKWSGTSSEAEIGKFAWYGRNSGEITNPVGQKRPNGLGLYDMSGNVYEYCKDGYDKDYYRNSPRNNPEGPGWGNDMIRGGGFNGSLNSIRSSNRGYILPEWKDFRSVGFRLVLLESYSDESQKKVSSREKMKEQPEVVPQSVQISIVMPRWKAVGNTPQDLSAKVYEMLANDLILSGFFKVIGYQQLPLSLQGKEGLPSTLFLQEWIPTGGESLLFGDTALESDGLNLKLIFQLYDLVKQKHVIGKKYEGHIQNLREMVSRMTNEVILQLIGKKNQLPHITPSPNKN